MAVSDVCRVLQLAPQAMISPESSRRCAPGHAPVSRGYCPYLWAGCTRSVGPSDVTSRAGDCWNGPGRRCRCHSPLSISRPMYPLTEARILAIHQFGDGEQYLYLTDDDVVAADSDTITSRISSRSRRREVRHRESSPKNARRSGRVWVGPYLTCAPRRNELTLQP